MKDSLPSIFNIATCHGKRREKKDQKGEEKRGDGMEKNVNGEHREKWNDCFSTGNE